MMKTFRSTLHAALVTGLSLSTGLLFAATAGAQHSVCDFEGFDETTPITDQYAADGVKFYLVGAEKAPMIATEGAPAMAWVKGFPIEAIDVAVSGVNSLTASGNFDYGMVFGATASSVGFYLSDFGDCAAALPGEPMTAYLDAYDADGLLVDSTSYTVARFTPGPDDGSVTYLEVSGTGIVRAETRGVAADCGHAIDDVAVTLESCVDWDRDGVCDTDDYCPNTELTDGDAGVPNEWLGSRRWADVDGDGVLDSGRYSETSYTLADTAGCSCAQILDELGAGKGHEKFGCSAGVLKRWIGYVEAAGY